MNSSDKRRLREKNFAVALALPTAGDKVKLDQEVLLLKETEVFDRATDTTQK